MKRLFLFLISSCVMQFAYSQEEIVLDSLSTAKPEVEMNGLLLGKPLILDKSMSDADEIFLPNLSLFNQPLFPDHSNAFDFKKYFNNQGLKTESFSSNEFVVSPFLQNGTTFNQATYRLNNRFSIGGNSFGAQSIFDTPKMNPNSQDMSIKGASMFMQYNVSKHFKIETRVSVTNHASPWEP